MPSGSSVLIRASHTLEFDLEIYVLILIGHILSGSVNAKSLNAKFLLPPQLSACCPDASAAGLVGPASEYEKFRSHHSSRKCFAG